VGWLPLLLTVAEAASPVVLLADEATLDGTSVVATAEAMLAEVAPDHDTAVRAVPYGERVDVTPSVLVLLPHPDVVGADALDLAVAAFWRASAYYGRYVLVVEPVVPPGPDVAVRQAAARVGTEVLAEADPWDDFGGRTVVPLGDALQATVADGVLDDDGRPTPAAGSWLAACLIVATATGRMPTADAAIPVRVVEACRDRALGTADAGPDGWRPWTRTWDEGTDADGSRWIVDTWYAPRVLLASSSETVARDLMVARGHGAARGALHVLEASLIVGGTLGLGGGPETPGGSAVLAVERGSYVQAARVELGDAEVHLGSGELRAGTLSAPHGLSSVRWPSPPCDARIAAARVEGPLDVTGCVELAEDAAVDGDLAVARGGTLTLKGSLRVDGSVLVLGRVVVDVAPPAGPLALVRAPTIAWDPSAVDVADTVPDGLRLRLGHDREGAVLWLESPEVDGPRGPFAPPLLPPGEAGPCGCAHRSGPSPGLLLLLAVVARRRPG
jgi:hypothetical protein